MHFDRRLAELSGNVKGLSEEMQSSIRRIDLMSDPLLEWQHQVEEEFRQKCADFEHGCQKISSDIRVNASTVDEIQKRQNQRLQRIEIEFADQLAIGAKTQD